MDAGTVRQSRCPQIWLLDCKRYDVQEILDTLFSDGKNILYSYVQVQNTSQRININVVPYIVYIVMHCSVLHKMWDN